MDDTATILVADDDDALLEALSVRLESHGYSVVRARDAVQAVSVARRTVPDLLILDINMPAGDGITVLARIRAIEDLGTVPAIYITGDRSARASVLDAETGAGAVLNKPLDMDRLLALTAEAVGDVESVRRDALADLQAAADQFAAQHGAT
jgi:two-component system response regulator MprA